MARIDDFQAEAATAGKAIWDGVNTLVALQREWNALDYSTSNQPNIAATGSVVFDTANAIVTVLNTGFATDIAKVL